jgi:octaprenyl-diphosphate synthase
MLDSMELISPKVSTDDPLDSIRHLIQHDYAQLEIQLNTSYQSDISLINEVSNHIVNAGGKRIRPLCLLLAAHALGFTDQAIIKAATAIEYIHTATLLHDDVVDESDLRRNQPTARKIWGNMASILVGDYLYSQAFALLVQLNHPEIMTILVKTTTLLAEGEAFQLMNRNNPQLSEADYRYIIKNKTGVLFETATLLAATLANASPIQKDALAQYGMHLGLAFQMIDDALDYQGNHQTIGKNIGDDLAEGSPTLPIIYALAHGTPEQKILIENAIKKASLDDLDKIIAAIEATSAIQYTAQCAVRESELAIAALDVLPKSPFRDGLIKLARFAVSRVY